MMMYGDTRISRGQGIDKISAYEKEVKKLGGWLEDSERFSFNPTIQTIVYFPNGYGISFIEGGISYGLEAGIIKKNRRGQWNLCYTTPITNDVIGYIKDKDILPLIKKVAKLK